MHQLLVAGLAFLVLFFPLLSLADWVAKLFGGSLGQFD
jgi:hypothetical protein